MPRNGSGTYVLPEPAFEPNTRISASPVNSDFDDVADALTNSVAKDGQTNMTGALKMAAAGATFVTDTDTGISLTDANEMTLKAGGVDTLVVDETGVDITGSVKSGGVPIGFVPIGGMIEWPTNSAPAKFLLCDGSAKSRTTYAALFDVIGTTFGVGDGSTTFNVPDRTGRTGVGRDASGSVLSGASTIGTQLGAQTVTLTAAQLPAATVNGSVAITDPGHTHTTNAPLGLSNPNQGNFGSTGFWLAGNTSSATIAPATTGITAAFTGSVAGSGDAHSNVQPSLVLNYIIYAGV